MRLNFEGLEARAETLRTHGVRRTPYDDNRQITAGMQPMTENESCVKHEYASSLRSMYVWLNTASNFRSHVNYARGMGPWQEGPRRGKLQPVPAEGSTG